MFVLYRLVFSIAVLSLIEVSSGETCNERCAVCDDGRCRECIYGWYGHSCNSQCQNCWITGCKKHSGICDQCAPGKYGEGCMTPCPENCRRDRNYDVYCRREDGKCQDGCLEGLWGETCRQKCNEQCKSGICLQNNGHCIGDCEEGWWGGSCDNTCSEGCLHNKCDGFSGKCHGECHKGYTAPFCNEKCADGCLICHQFTKSCEKCSPNRYGHHCTVCSQTCKNYTCDMNGKCVEGCTEGFMGEVCDKLCPANCLTCDRDGEVCKKCETGWTGNLCNKKETTNTKSTFLLRNIHTDSGNNGSVFYLHWALVTLCVVPSILQGLRC